MVSYYRAFAPKSEAVNCWDNRATLKISGALCILLVILACMNLAALGVRKALWRVESLIQVR